MYQSRLLLGDGGGGGGGTTTTRPGFVQPDLLLPRVA